MHDRGGGTIFSFGCWLHSIGSSLNCAKYSYVCFTRTVDGQVKYVIR